MAPVSCDRRVPARTLGQADGFSLIEAMIATLVLTVGLLALVGVMAIGLQTVSTSSFSLIAREKAREAVESVHTARDTGELAWDRVNNVASGGDFLDGAQDMRTPGPDGLVNTDDDGDIEELRAPGPDGEIDNDDDILTPLSATLFQREISITPLNIDGTETENQNLRQVIVTVSYRIRGAWRTYTLTTFVSSYS